jgi:NADH-quinone oxidoreductase subunit M
MVVAAATRLPLFPFHGWSRDVYAEAPVGVAVVVAGSASRLGAYLLLRTLVAAEPAAAHLLAPLLALLAALTVGYAALVALRATDLRHIGALLALIPGGVTVLALAALSPLAIGGAVLSFFAGGLAAALIVGACATLADRAQSRSLQVLSGLAPRMPMLTWLLILGGLAVLGVPLLATFPAELMTFFGSFKTQPNGAFAVAAGLAVAAVALASLFRRVLFGSPNPDAPGVSDASLGETWYLALLAGGLLWVGLYPGGPKLPGTDTPLFDPGLVNVMSAGLSDIASPYAGPNPGTGQ